MNRIKPFVREQLLLSVAIIVKASWFHENSLKMEPIFQFTLQALNSTVTHVSFFSSFFLSIK